MVTWRLPRGTAFAVLVLLAKVWIADGVTGATVITAISPSSITVSTASTITLTGGYGAGDLLDFGANCGSVTPATSAASGSVSITIGATGTGLKLCYRANGESDSQEQTGITLDVITASPNNRFTEITPQFVYASVATAITLTGVANSGDKATFSQDCSSATPNVALTVGTNKASTFTLGSTGTMFRLCFRKTGGTDSVPQDNIYLTVNGLGGIGADPVAWYGNKVRVFSFPPKTLMPLMTASDMELHGETFSHGGPWQQWFGRLVLASPGGDRWVQIKIRKDILEFNRTRAPKGHFETLEVSLGHGSFDDPSVQTQVLGPDIHIPLSFLGFDVVFWKMARNSRAANTMIGAAHRECMEVAGANVHFYVCSSPAHEFYGWQRDLAVELAHLDLAIIEVIDGTAVRGTMPELWGMQPLSEATKAYIIHEEDTSQLSSTQTPVIEAPSNFTTQKDVLVGVSLPKLPASSLPAGKAWAGGFGLEELKSSCKQGNQTVLGCKAFPEDNQTVLVL